MKCILQWEFEEEMCWILMKIMLQRKTWCFLEIWHKNKHVPHQAGCINLSYMCALNLLEVYRPHVLVIRYEIALRPRVKGSSVLQDSWLNCCIRSALQQLINPIALTLSLRDWLECVMLCETIFLCNGILEFNPSHWQMHLNINRLCRHLDTTGIGMPHAYQFCFYYNFTLPSLINCARFFFLLLLCLLMTQHISTPAA